MKYINKKYTESMITMENNEWVKLLLLIIVGLSTIVLT